MDMMGISKEAFTQMIREMDTDNNGTVDEAEYRVVFMRMNPAATERKFQEAWKAIDIDGDGSLTVEELARHFGYSWDGESACEMTDEQILEALQMHALLLENEEAKRRQKEAQPKEKPSAINRDKTLTQYFSDPKKNKTIDGFELFQRLDEALMLGDILTKSDGSDAQSVLGQPGLKVRFIDTEGKMPLHKLARVKVDDKNRLDFKAVFQALIKIQREQCEKVKRKLGPDINHQDKQGKTPLFYAVENKNTTMIDLLFRLKEDGPDVLLVNSVGWTVLHAATEKCDLATMETLFKWFSPGRKKVLLNTKDKTGRVPLHIAAYRDEHEESAVCSFLIKHGAKNSEKDTAGNVPSQLAAKTGRRKSKELIEDMTGTVQNEPETRGRRRSRDSKETLDAMKAASEKTELLTDALATKGLITDK